MKRLRTRSRNTPQRGAAAMVFLLVLPALLGVIGFAIDLSRLYSRKIEMQQSADAIALAAATRLDGTQGGVARAAAAAVELVGTMPLSNGHMVSTYWTSEALSFASSPDAADSEWLTKDAVNATNAPGLLYAKVDTGKLVTSALYGDDASVVQMAMASFLPGVASSFNVNARAVAGKLVVPITPIAVCAVSTSATGTHTNNGVSADPLAYGFRLGVSYNLLQLDHTGSVPAASTAGRAWLVNPIDPIDHANSDSHFDAEHVKPFICAGKSAIGQMGGREVYLKSITGSLKASGFNLADWLNSRFGTTTCNPKGAPPDSNVREFYGNANGYSNWYMQVTQYDIPAAASYNDNNGNVVAFADLPYKNAQYNATPAPSEKSFGPLWAYSKPTGFKTADWPKMYQVTAVGKIQPPAGGQSTDTTFVRAANANYPKTTPYYDKSHSLAPSEGGGVAERRVLNIPLLDCSAGTPSSQGKVLAVGRFFMTGKATDTVIPGEFAGTVKTPVNGAVLFR